VENAYHLNAVLFPVFHLAVRNEESLSPEDNALLERHVERSKWVQFQSAESLDLGMVRWNARKAGDVGRLTKLLWRLILQHPGQFAEHRWKIVREVSDRSFILTAWDLWRPQGTEDYPEVRTLHSIQPSSVLPGLREGLESFWGGIEGGGAFTSALLRPKFVWFVFGIVVLLSPWLPFTAVSFLGPLVHLMVLAVLAPNVQAKYYYFAYFSAFFVFPVWWWEMRARFPNSAFYGPSIDP
jgi:hypothetical protein